MTGIERAVEDHYAAYNVLERIRAGLVAGGHDPDRIAPDVLKPVDEFHIGGAEATATLLDDLDIAPDGRRGLRVEASAAVTGQTGVEMEALTAVSVACLTIYDMVKAVERSMRIEGIRLIEKRGGKSGHFRAKAAKKAKGVAVPWR